jgi:hypothetical protein
MRRLALGLMLAAVNCTPSMADEACPARSQSYDAIVAAISSSPSCSRAFAVMKACLFVASGDVGLAQAVKDKCEPDFLAKLSPAQRRRYAAIGARCVSKYAGQEGTMYISFAATCEAQAAVDYASKFGKR